MEARSKQEQPAVDHAVRPSSASICSSARRTAASPAAAAISLGGSLGSRSAGSEMGAGLTRFCRFTRTATANGSPVTLPLITCRLRRRCQNSASSDQSSHHLLDCRSDTIPRIGELDLCQIGHDSPLSNAIIDDPLKARRGQRNVQVPNRRRIFRPWREVTSHSLLTPMAAEISRSLFGNATSELTSISASLGLRNQTRQGQRFSGSPKYTCPVFRRDLDRSIFSILVKKTSTDFKKRVCFTRPSPSFVSVSFGAFEIAGVA